MVEPQFEVRLCVETYGDTEAFRHNVETRVVHAGLRTLLNNPTAGVLALLHEIGHAKLVAEGHASQPLSRQDFFDTWKGKKVLHGEAAAWRVAVKIIRTVRALSPQERATIKQYYGTYLANYNRGF